MFPRSISGSPFPNWNQNPNRTRKETAVYLVFFSLLPSFAISTPLVFRGPVLGVMGVTELLYRVFLCGLDGCVVLFVGVTELYRVLFKFPFEGFH